jgi:MFS family permease
MPIAAPGHPLDLLEPAPPPQPRVSDHRRVWVVWAGWLALMTSANVATPLYPVYAARFHFSTLVLTLVFATYAVVLVPALVVFGRISDVVGRRPVIVGGFSLAAISLVVFAAASSVGYLFAARALQGLAVGMVSGAATAALVELDDGRSQRPAMLAGIAQAGGSGLGPLVGGVLTQWAPGRRETSFAVLLVVMVIAIVAVIAMREPAGAGATEWRIQRPDIPDRIRRDFWRVSLTAATAWGSVALYLSIVPSYAEQLLSTHNLALFGVIAALALACSCVAQVVARRRGVDDRRRGSRAGLLAMVAGLVLLVVAAPTHALVLLVISAIAVGSGHGIAFLSAQDELNELSPDEQRGEVTAAFIAVIYAVVAASSVGAGLLDAFTTLPVAVTVVCGCLVALELAAVSLQRR